MGLGELKSELVRDRLGEFGQLEVDFDQEVDFEQG